MATKATTPARSGETSAGSTTLSRTALKRTASGPAAASVAPISPPNSAWDELDGRPSSQVSRFHTMAPTSPAKMTAGVILTSSTRPSGDGLRHLDGQECAGQVQGSGDGNRDPGPECSGRDGGGHGVRRVVKAVREIKNQCGDHDHHHDDGYVHVPRLSLSARSCLREAFDIRPRPHFGPSGSADDTSGHLFRVHGKVRAHLTPSGRDGPALRAPARAGPRCRLITAG